MSAQTLENTTSDGWWLGVVVGVVTILFGIAALFWPGLTLTTFVYLFSAYVLAWGVILIIRSLLGINGLSGVWWLSLLFGVLALGLGVYLVRHPGVTFATLVLFVGFTFIIRGVFDIVEGLFGNKTATGRVLSMIAGGIGILAGVFVLMQPVTGGVAFVWILGLYALIFGPIAIAMSMDERGETVDVVPGTATRR